MLAWLDLWSAILLLTVNQLNSQHGCLFRIALDVDIESANAISFHMIFEPDIVIQN